MKIGIDLDGTISDAPAFFAMFSKICSDAGHEIHIITDRVPGTEDAVARECQMYGITFHHIKITSDKASYIVRQKITVYFDDIDRYFLELPIEVTVFKIRNIYNFDVREQKWVQPHETVILV
jgi:hypothetical protein